MIFLFDNVLMMMAKSPVLHVSEEILMCVVSRLFTHLFFIFTMIVFLPLDHKNIKKMLIVTFLLLTEMKCLPEGKKLYPSNTTRWEKRAEQAQNGY